MMTYPHRSARPVVLKARRDTIGLVVLATMSTFALAHLVDSHRIATPATERLQGWTGGLAGVAAPNAGRPEPMTSASLVVPELALPQAPLRPLVRLSGCAGGSCLSRSAGKVADVPLPPRKLSAERPVANSPSMVAAVETASRREKRSLASRLNPFANLPDASTIKRPFVFASDAVSGWFKRF